MRNSDKDTIYWTGHYSTRPLMKGLTARKSGGHVTVHSLSLSSSYDLFLARMNLAISVRLTPR